MFTWVIYFAGPRTRWSARIDAEEIIAQGAAPWRWLARTTMLGTFRGLDASKCGYALMAADVCIEQYDPPLPLSGSIEQVSA